MKNKKLKIKKGDKVLVLSGKDKGKKGKILKVFPKSSKVVVEGVNIIKKHQRQTQNFKGGIVDRPNAMTVDKVMLICPRCNSPARVGKKVIDQKRVRFCRKCKEVVDKL